MTPTEYEKALTDETPDALFAVSLDGRVLSWNRGAESTFGYPSEEAVGQMLHELILPADAVEGDLALQQEALARGVANCESLRRKKDGSLISVHVSLRTVRNAAGEPLYFVRNTKDVTYLKAQRDTKLVEARYRDLLESTPDAIVIINNTGRIVFVNGQAESVFGYTRAELLGEPIEILLPPRYRGGHVGHRSNYFSQPRTRSMGAGLELYGIRKNGEEFPVEISLSPLRTEEGSLAISAIRDISSRKKAEHALRQSQDLLQMLAASVKEYAFITLDATGHIVSWNSGAERIKGYRADEIVGQHCSRFYPPEEVASGAPASELAIAAEAGRFEREGWRIRKDGSRFWANAVITALRDPSGELRGFGKVTRDITDRKNFEEALTQKNVAMERAVQAKDRFLASMSHELRTPLNAILGFTGTLLMKLPGPLNSTQEGQLRTVQSSAKHLLSLINDLLDLTRMESGEVALALEPVDCGELIHEVVASLRPLAETKGLHLKISAAEAAIVLPTDRRALSQILLNLINNALKFTDQGCVCVELGRRSGMVQITVSDTGIGISAEDQARLFAAFMQIDNSSTRRYEGTGLGLHLSQKLAGLIGGAITVESAPGEGSTFILTLPEKAS